MKKIRSVYRLISFEKFSWKNNHLKVCYLTHYCNKKGIYAVKG